jgi:Zn-dependent peptidase ImmA (M78 family)/transcriptional regulator with XRE-family HTH domain
MGDGREDAQVDQDILQAIDPRELGRTLQEARKAKGLTQQAVASSLGIARTTLTAIEKGERRVQASELVRLAAMYGRSVGEFVRKPVRAEPFTVQFRAVLAPGMEIETAVSAGLSEFESLCADYLELERLCGAPLPRRYPEVYRTEGTPPDAAAEDVAGAERNRLGIGDGPFLNLRETLENDVGLRVFYIDLPSRIAEMFAYTEEYGGCLAVNNKHPEDRRRMSLAHGYGHFLTSRYKPEVDLIGRYQRVPEHERFTDSFARALLMPASGLRRRFHETKRSRSRGTFTPTDLCTLALFYFVSVEAMTLRLEELRLLPGGTWERLRTAGFKVQEAKDLLHLQPREVSDQKVPSRYTYLAVEAFNNELITEGQLAHFLRADRLEARRIVADFTNRTVVSDEGIVGTLPLELGESLSA